MTWASGLEQNRLSLRYLTAEILEGAGHREEVRHVLQPTRGG